MILGGAHDLHNISVHEGQYGYLTACHKLLDDDLITRGAELLIHHQGLNALFCLFQCLADQNALSKRKTVCLQYDRHLCGLKILQRLFRVCKCLISRCRDIVLLHKVLGKCLGTLEDRRVLSRSEYTESLFLEDINDSAYKRIVHTDHGKIDLFFFRESN